MQRPLYDLVNDANGTPSLSHMAKYIILTDENPELNEIRVKMEKCNIAKFIILYESYKSVFMINYNSILSEKPEKTEITEDNINTITYFKDMLKDIQKFPLTVIGFDDKFADLSPIEAVKTSVRYPYAEIVAEKLNASLNIVALDGKNLQETYHVVKINTRSKFHLVLSSRFMIYTNATKLMTFEQNAECFIIPKCNVWHILKIVMFAPFEARVWRIYGMCLLITAMVWRFFKNRGAVDNSWYLLFKLFGHFLGQSIPMRLNRRILTIALQIYIFSLLILSNIYQSKLLIFENFCKIFFYIQVS